MSSGSKDRNLQSPDGTRFPRRGRGRAPQARRDTPRPWLLHTLPVLLVLVRGGVAAALRIAGRVYSWYHAPDWPEIARLGGGQITVRRSHSWMLGGR